MCGHAFYVWQIEMEKSTQISKNWTRIRRVWYCAVKKRFFFCCGVFIFEKSTHTQSETVEEKRRNCNNHKSHMSWVLLCVFLALFLSLSFSFCLYILMLPPLFSSLCLLFWFFYFTYIAETCKYLYIDCRDLRHDYFHSFRIFYVASVASLLFDSGYSSLQLNNCFFLWIFYIIAFFGVL